MLARGEWVNVFPEGNVVQNQNYRIKRLKWGIAKAIVESSKQGKIPILLPWVHRGMEDVIPLKNPYLPLPGKKVKVLIGEPLPIQKTIQAGEKLLKNNPGWGNPFPPPEELLYQQIMDDMAESLEKHQEELEQVWE